jgi:hypothetical protein
MKTFKLTFLSLSFLVINACSPDAILNDSGNKQTEELVHWKPADGIRKWIPTEYLSNIREQDLSFLEKEMKGEKSMEQRRNEIHVVANSMNALAGAIASSQPGDVIVLDPGDHFETGTVVVNKSVTIEGYSANLVFSNTPFTPDFITNIAPAFHIKSGGATSTLRGITFKSTEGTSRLR